MSYELKVFYVAGFKTQKTDVNKRCAKNRCKYVGDVPKAGVSERFARPASNSNPYKNFKASQ